MKTLQLWFPILTVGATIFLTSQLINEVPVISLQLGGDLNTASIGHVVLYFGLGFFIARYLRKRLALGCTGVLILTLSLCVSIGVFDEFHQMFVTGRNAEFGDLLSDLIGGSLGALLIIAWIRRPESQGELRTRDDGRNGSLLEKATAASVFVCFVSVVVVVVTGTVPSSFRVLAAESIASADRMLRLYMQPENTTVAGPKSEVTSESTSVPAGNQHQAKTETSGFLKVNGSMLGYSAQLHIGKPEVVASAAVTKSPDPAPHTLTAANASTKDSTAAVPAKPQSETIKRTSRVLAAKRANVANRKDHTRYLARFKNELAKLEIKEVRMVRYSDLYPPKVLLQEKIQYLRDKILQISSNPPQTGVSATTQDYLDALKQKLADLELKELHMIAYSETYHQKALIKDKIALLRKKISQAQFRAESTEHPQTNQKPAVFSQSGDGSKNNRAMIRLSSLPGR